MCVLILRRSFAGNRSAIYERGYSSKWKIVKQKSVYGKTKVSVTNTDIRLGIGFAIALLIVHFFPTVQALSAGTAVIMCTQDNDKVTLKSGLIRLEGVLIGGICALIVVLLDNAINNPYLFILLCGLGIVLNLVCCKLAKMPGIVARASCITFALVALALQGEARIKYALLRVLGTAVGALLSLVIAWIWGKCFGKSDGAPQKEKAAVRK